MSGDRGRSRFWVPPARRDGCSHSLPLLSEHIVLVRRQCPGGAGRVRRCLRQPRPR